MCTILDTKFHGMYYICAIIYKNKGYVGNQ